MIVDRKLIVLRMVGQALDQVDSNKGLPAGEDDFITLVIQFGARYAVTREEVTALLKQPLYLLVESLTDKPVFNGKGE